MFYSTYRNECQGPRAEKTLPSERDGDEDGGEEDDEDSDNDLQIVLEQSGTADSTGAASGGTEAPAKKAKITLTEEEENFAKQFRPAASKIDKERKIPLRHVSGRGCGDMSRRVGSVMLVKFCSHSQVSKESLSASIHIGGTGLATCLRRG